MSCALAPMQEFVPVSLYLYPSIPAAGALFYSLFWPFSACQSTETCSPNGWSPFILSLSLSLGHSVLVNWVEMGFVDWVLRWIMFGWVEIGFVCARQTVENARYKALGINP